MEFVEAGVKRGDYESARVTRLSKRPAQERSEDCIFGQVRAFPDNELNGGDRGVGNIGREPAQEWRDETRGVGGRKQIGRADEDENHPGDNGQPVFEEWAHRKRNHKAIACANLAA